MVIFPRDFISRQDSHSILGVVNLDLSTRNFIIFKIGEKTTIERKYR